MPSLRRVLYSDDFEPEEQPPLRRARQTDAERDQRIAMEVIVDAYGEDEQALGWYYYLENQVTFPFRARCIAERTISPLRMGDEVRVTGLPDADDCMHEMFVLVVWQGRTFGVPLVQLAPIAVDEDTLQAIEDWHYWKGSEWAGGSGDDEDFDDNEFDDGEEEDLEDEQDE